MHSLESQRLPDFTAIDAHISAVMSADRLPGASVAIVHDGQLVHARGFGTDGTGRPVTVRTGFMLGSMSKAFTALAIMQLVDRGVVALDAPAQRYVPWFRVADRNASATITVRQLLHHTSGIPTRAARAKGKGRTLSDHVRALSSTTLSQAPGIRHEYASPNYIVLGAIVEAVTGVSYATYVEREIYAPLAMRDSYTDRARAFDHGMAQGHLYLLGFPLALTLPFEGDRLPTAALISSAQDMAQFLIAQLQDGVYQGAPVVSATAAQAMHRGVAQAAGCRYGFGWRDGVIGGARAVYHGGVTPTFRGKMVMLPEAGWGVVVLTNASTGIPLPIMPTSHRLADEIAAYLAGVPLPPPTSPGWRRALAVASAVLRMPWR